MASQSGLVWMLIDKLNSRDSFDFRLFFFLVSFFLSLSPVSLSHIPVRSSSSILFVHISCIISLYYPNPIHTNPPSAWFHSFHGSSRQPSTLLFVWFPIRFSIKVSSLRLTDHKVYPVYTMVSARHDPLAWLCMRVKRKQIMNRLLV